MRVVRPSMAISEMQDNAKRTYMHEANPNLDQKEMRSLFPFIRSQQEATMIAASR